MTMLTGEFEVASWDENAYLELEGGRKMTRADVTQRFSGGVDGTGIVVWLMAYAEDGTARFVGLQHVQGSVGGREGGFVMETMGDFDGEKAVGTWSVIPASATGELVGIRGEGRFQAPRGPKASYTLDVTLA
jgi:uncharacterized protein DUF3224